MKMRVLIRWQTVFARCLRPAHFDVKFVTPPPPLFLLEATNARTYQLWKRRIPRVFSVSLYSTIPDRRTARGLIGFEASCF